MQNNSDKTALEAHADLKFTFSYASEYIYIVLVMKFWQVLCTARAYICQELKLFWYEEKVYKFCDPNISIIVHFNHEITTFLNDVFLI